MAGSYCIVVGDEPEVCDSWPRHWSGADDIQARNSHYWPMIVLQSERLDGPSRRKAFGAYCRWQDTQSAFTCAFW